MKKSWFELALSDDEVRTDLHTHHGCIAADGMRAHIEPENGACQCGNDKLHKGFDQFLENVKNFPIAFVVNRKYLLDALSGINPDGTAVVFFMEQGGASPIVIQDPDGEKTAIIMPMYAEAMRVEKMKKLPRVTPKSTEQVQP